MSQPNSFPDSSADHSRADDDPVTLPAAPPAPAPAPPMPPPDPDPPEPEFDKLVRNGCLMLLGAFIAAWLILAAQIPSPVGGH